MLRNKAGIRLSEEEELEAKLEEIEGKDVISEEEFDLLDKHGRIPEHTINWRAFSCPKCGQRYYIHVAHFEDGEYPDEMNTRIYVTMKK